MVVVGSLEESSREIPKVSSVKLPLVSLLCTLLKKKSLLILFGGEGHGMVSSGN